MKYGDMFKELVAAGIITYGGGNEGKKKTAYSCGVQYSETFYKYWTGLQPVTSFDDLEDLHSKWKQAGTAGIVAWLAVKEGCLPFHHHMKDLQSKYDFASLNLPSNPNDNNV